MTQIRYKTPVARVVLVLPPGLALAGILFAGLQLNDPFSLADWKGAVLGAPLYLRDLLAHAYDTKTLQVLASADRRTLFFLGGFYAIPGVSVLLALGFLIATLAAPTRNYAAFANPAELRRMPVNGTLGPILGKAHGKILRAEEPRHVLAVAPTRSGKTRQVTASVLDYGGSVVVVDPKAEIRQITEPHRAKIGETYTISFADPNTPHGWNPLSITSVPADTVDIELYANRLASVLVPDPPSNAEPHWTDTALRNVVAFLALEIYRILKSERDSHISALLKNLTDLPPAVNRGDDPFALKMAALAQEAAALRAPQWVADDLIAFAEIDARERSSHVSTLRTKLQFYRGEATRRSLGRSDFQFDDLRTRPNTVYVDFPQRDARAFGPVTMMFLDALFTHALGTGRKEDEYPILVVIDEFRDLPPIPNLVPLMTKGASAGISAYILVQDMEQLRERYRDAAVNIENNAEFTLIYETPSIDTQRKMEQKAGITQMERQSRSVNKLGFSKGKNVSTAERALIERADFGVIPFGKHVLFARRHLVRPVLCDTVFWDKHRAFRKLVPAANRRKT